MDRESLRLLLAQGLSLEEIGRRFGKHPSTVGYWVQKHGLEAAGRAKHAPKGGIAREVLEPLVNAGLSSRGLARELGVSQATVRHWLKRYGLGTARNKQVRAPANEPTVERVCATHGRVKFVLEGRGYYRCTRCRADRVAQRRRKLKEILVAEAGGCCVLCGYDAYLGALQFHHLDPTLKEFALGLRGMTRSLERARMEAAKCVLLCANCHAEVEGGVRTLPSVDAGAESDVAQAA